MGGLDRGMLGPGSLGMRPRQSSSGLPSLVPQAPKFQNKKWALPHKAKFLKFLECLKFLKLQMSKEIFGVATQRQVSKLKTCKAMQRKAMRSKCRAMQRNANAKPSKAKQVKAMQRNATSHLFPYPYPQKPLHVTP